jgi:hypothetical protein
VWVAHGHVVKDKCLRQWLTAARGATKAEAEATVRARTMVRNMITSDWKVLWR